MERPDSNEDRLLEEQRSWTRTQPDVKISKATIINPQWHCVHTF